MKSPSVCVHHVIKRPHFLVLVMWLMLIAHPAFAQNATSTALPPDWLPASGALPEPPILRKFVNASDGVISDRDDRRDGPYVQMGQTATGAGWISIGPGYRHQLLNGRAFVDGSAAVSWRLYRAAQARFELPHLAHDRLMLGTQVTYQDFLQVNYFGLGDQSSVSDRSSYRLNNTDVLGLASVRPAHWLSLDGRLGWIPRVDLSTATGRGITVPNTLDEFSERSAPGITSEPSFLHGDVSIAADWRDHAGHPTHGGLYRATAGTYSDRSETGHSFQRFDLEASQYLPLFTRRVILGMRAWEVISTTSKGQTVPYYLMPSLGGHNTLRGYYDYRFHDNNMQAVNAEVRWSLFTHLDAAAFADAGKVAARTEDLDFTDLRKSFGFGFRVHNATSTLVRLDVGHSVEGWHVFVKLSDAFKRSAPAHAGPAIVPFVP